MPTPTIPAGNLYMNATLWTGNGTTQNITNGATGQAFQPDMVWVKGRSVAYSHYIEDSVRGVGKDLSPNGTGAEATYNLLTSFNSNGFSVSTSSGTYLASNDSGVTYVGWNWKAGGTAVTNTSGTISSQVSANTTSGFSVVTYTGNGSAGATVGHGLGVAPSMVIVKRRSAASNWSLSSPTIGATKVLFLEQTAAATTDNGPFNSTLASSSVITLGSSTDTNANGGTFVAYCWSEIAGFSKFGSYTGNGSADGPFIYTGFRPKFVMIKRTDNVGDWYMLDTSRDPYNLVTQKLMADLSAVENGNGESTSTNTLDILSNGFKMRSTNTASNTSGGTYIYMAFAENPFKYANAR